MVLILPTFIVQTHETSLLFSFKMAVRSGFETIVFEDIQDGYLTTSLGSSTKSEDPTAVFE